MPPQGEIPDPIDHVLDQKHWEFFERLFGGVDIDLPLFTVFGHTVQVTKYMLLELLAAILLIAIFVPIARKARNGAMPKGPFWNAFESLLTFIREEIAKPNLGEHEADGFVPFLWTQFTFILFLNLMGMFPWLGSPTASVWVTGALAIIVFVLMHAVPIVKFGVFRYLKSLVPDTGLGMAGLPIALMIFFIELLGTVIKSFVLSVRLFANMFAGHVVLAMILTFIIFVGNDGFSAIWPVVTVFSVLGVTALSLLELFVGFLQAYVFTFLTALFIGMALHHAGGDHEEEHAEAAHAH
jgi:F-type H+-transporting ATPase subunit a